MTVTVRSTITYCYDVEVPQWLCEKDEDGELIHEDALVYLCYEADENGLTEADEWESNIDSIWTKDTKEDLYYS